MSMIVTPPKGCQSLANTIFMDWKLTEVAVKKQPTRHRSKLSSVALVLDQTPIHLLHHSLRHPPIVNPLTPPPSVKSEDNEHTLTLKTRQLTNKCYLRAYN